MIERLHAARFPRPVTASEVRADWARRGYSCHDFADPPGRQWNNFVHDTNELVTVLEGRLRLLVGGSELLLDPGDEAFIGRGEPHSVHNIHLGISRWLFGYD